MDDAWREGLRAWNRLDAWRAGDSAAALDALADIGTVRRVLDQTELAAVRAARRARRSWSEIAVQLGITRQSAWERWRDLDDDESEEGVDADEILTSAPGLIRVPDVVGMLWDEARDVLGRARLSAVGPDPDKPPPSLLDWPSGIVVSQYPAPGTRVPPHTKITLRVERGGGEAGVREPRRPGPVPRAGRAVPEEMLG